MSDLQSRLLELEQVSLHEAGHAVVARLVGIEVVSASIRRHHGPGRGRVWYRPTGVDPHRRAVVALAGLAATGPDGTNLDVARDDLANVRRIVAETRVDVEQCFRWLKDATDLVEANRAAVDLVAVELVKRSELSGVELDALLATRAEVVR